MGDLEKLEAKIDKLFQIAVSLELGVDAAVPRTELTTMASQHLKN